MQYSCIAIKSYCLSLQIRSNNTYRNLRGFSMTKEKDKYIYPISVAAKLLDITPETLRMYEQEGVFKSNKSDGGKRFYSNEDIEYFKYIRHLIHDEKISIKCIKKLLEIFYLYEISESPKKQRIKAFGIKNDFEFKVMSKACKNLFE